MVDHAHRSASSEHVYRFNERSIVSCALDVNVKMVSWSPEDEGVLRLLRLLIITITSIVSVLLVVKELKRTVIRRAEHL